MSGIKTMFDPKTISLIGATEHSGAVGRAILENLLPPGSRKIFPVNPHKEKILELKCYPNIAGIPEHIDLAVIATPAKTVPEIVEECGKAGVDGVTIISAGFKEIG
jgi:acetyltransferase